MTDAAIGGHRDARNTKLMRAYGVLAGVLAILFPLLSPAWRTVDFLVGCVLAIPCVAFGRRAVRPGYRLPWTLLLTGLVALATGIAIRLRPTEIALTVGLLVDAAGYLLVLAAALALIVRRGSSDLGGILDTTVIAFAAGGLLWGVALPHRLGLDDSPAAQVNLLVVVFALTGVFGPLARMCRPRAESGSALRWLMIAVGLAIVGNILLAVAGGNTALHVASRTIFMVSFAGIGLFGLDPSGPQLARPIAAPSTERLSVGRLAFLGGAVAALPVFVGARDFLGGSVNGLFLALLGAAVATLVMVRVGLLSAQRAKAERALMYQAAHDPLTHLLNRRELVARLSYQLSLDTRCALLFCDLDDFKVINDRLGHAAGDQLLVALADRLRTCVRPPHLVSRFGGDEFVILLVDSNVGEILSMQARITTALVHPFDQIGGAAVGISIGVALANGTRDPEHLIRAADRAMYQTKMARAYEPSPGTSPVS